MLNWLISPSETFAVRAEFFSDVGLAAFTVIALIFVAAEYAAEHLDWPWGHTRKAVFAVFVVVGFLGELIFEMGSFRFAYALQGAQAKTIEGLETKADRAKSEADAALTEATTAGNTAQTATDQIRDFGNKEQALRAALVIDERAIRNEAEYLGGRVSNKAAI